MTENGKPSFWSTAPGIVTAVAGLISAIGVLIGSLVAAGVIGGDDGSGSVSSSTGTTQSSNGAPTSSIPAVDRVFQYGGTWTTDDPAPNTVARIAIEGSGPNVNVHAFAACRPVDCDWGTKTPSFSDPLVAVFDLGNGRTEELTMLLSSDATQLEVTEQSSVSGRHEYSFHR